MIYTALKERPICQQSQWKLENNVVWQILSRAGNNIYRETVYCLNNLDYWYLKRTQNYKGILKVLKPNYLLCHGKGFYACRLADGEVPLKPKEQFCQNLNQFCFGISALTSFIRNVQAYSLHTITPTLRYSKTYKQTHTFCT